MNNEKQEEEMNEPIKERLEVELFFIVAGIITIIFAWQFMPDHRWHDGTPQHAIFKAFWWICSAVVALLTWKSTAEKKEFTAWIGFIVTALMGPAVLLMTGMVLTYRKVRRGKQ